MTSNNLIDSPLGYTGNKYKLLPKLLPLFPESISTFYDAFCGGLSVSLNVKADKIIVNDVSAKLIEMYTVMRHEGYEFIDFVDKILDGYNITPDNEAGYMKLRSDYNNVANLPHSLFALIVTAYNSLFRFNSDGEFNAPFGFDKNTFNARKRENVKYLIDFLSGDVVISCGSYSQVEVPDDAFVYCDPPYLITNAAYNNTWNHVSEYELLRWLDKLNDRGIKFGVSNVIRHKGKYNRVLDDWAKRYKVHHLDYKYTTYANGTKSVMPTEEVYICNY